jgi:hypothetical protein
MVQPLGQGGFPMEGMMGPQSQLQLSQVTNTGQIKYPPGGGGVINPKTTTFAPGGFEELLNALRGAGRAGADKMATPTGTKITGLAAPTLYAAGSLMQGDIAQGVGELGGGLVGSQLVSGIASGLEKGGAKGKLLGGAVRLAGGLLGGGIGGGVASAVSGGVANAANAITGGAARTQMTAGTSPGAIPGVGGTGIGFSNDDIARIDQLSKITGRSQVDIAREMLPIQNQYLDNQMQRQMQLNQQTGQLTGALNRQAYTAQLAGGAQSQAGETVRTMMTAPNPYAQSAFQYRG